MEVKDIEKFFLNTLLRISIAGLIFTLLVDISFIHDDTLSISLDIIILSACLIAYVIRNRSKTFSVLTLTCITLVGMIYQSLAVPTYAANSLNVILLVGFVFSVMLKGRLLWIMHGITFAIVIFIFAVQFLNPSLRFSTQVNEIVSAAVTYSILYFILTYATRVLKFNYDKIHENLNNTNIEINLKATEIANQNEELLQIQEKINTLNLDLENKVNERTQKIQIQNETLIKYSYTNAHNLRGPIARLLGLAYVYKLDPSLESDFIINKMVDQAKEIDSVVKQINHELTSSSIDLQIE
jgi:signal transduction histidine kinase